METEETQKKETIRVEEIVEQEDKKNLRFYLWNKIETWIRKHPKRTYYILMTILLLTTCSAFFNLFFKREKKQPQNHKTIESTSSTNNSSLTNDALEMYEMERDKRELDYYKQKGAKNLTPEETEKAKYLIDKYQANQQNQKQP